MFHSIGLVVGFFLTAVLLGVVGSAVNTIIGKCKIICEETQKVYRN